MVSYTQNNFTDIQTLQNIKAGKDTDVSFKKITATEGLEIPSGKPVRFGTSSLGTSDRFVIYETGGQLRIEQGDGSPVITLENRKTSTGRLQVTRGLVENYDVKDAANYSNTLGNVMRYGTDLYIHDGNGYYHSL